MATYDELANIKGDAGYPDLLGKIQVAVTIKASTIIDSTDPAKSLLDWAKYAVNSPGPASNAAAEYVIATNSGLTTAQILGASDSAIQSNIDNAIDNIYGP